MKKILFVLLGIFLTGLGLFCFFDKPLPVGIQGSKAEALAHKMMASINHESWLETGAISWGYDDRTFVWDKENHLVQVKFAQHSILLNINKRQGVILSESESLSEEDKRDLCLMAWKYWANDSFWLNPISKVFDPGTERRLVQMAEGTDALLITYTSGGPTPGDSYLWILDENGKPTDWQFWVSIIPMGGMPFTWDSWMTLSTGVQIATHHHNPIKTVKILNPKAAYTLSDLGYDRLFAPLQNQKGTHISF